VVYLKKYLASSWASKGTSGLSRSPTPFRESRRPTMSGIGQDGVGRGGIELDRIGRGGVT
jgi:hypothetical protein